MEEHQQNGGNPDVDVSYQYLRVFLDDDEELETLYKVTATFSFFCSCLYFE
jgi:tryptophanyl-tRNA synthetase